MWGKSVCRRCFQEPQLLLGCRCSLTLTQGLVVQLSPWVLPPKMLRNYRNREMCCNPTARGASGSSAAWIGKQPAARSVPEA